MTKVTHEERAALAAQHATNPVVGDYWHDQYSPCFLVLAVGEGEVQFFHKTKEVDCDHWTWDDSAIERMSVADFARRLAYGTITGYWVDVVPAPNKMMPFIEAFFVAHPRGTP